MLVYLENTVNNLDFFLWD